MVIGGIQHHSIMNTLKLKSEYKPAGDPAKLALLVAGLDVAK
jgi:hypothetical protein